MPLFRGSSATCGPRLSHHCQHGRHDSGPGGDDQALQGRLKKMQAAQRDSHGGFRIDVDAQVASAN